MTPLDTAPRSWLETRLPIYATWRRTMLDVPVPANLTLIWSFGALVALSLAVLTITGIWLGLAYVPTSEGAAMSVLRYTRDVPFGWLIRDLHLDGTTMLFGVVFIELYRGLYYGSYRHGRELVWLIEVFRFFMFLTIGFFGFAMTGSAPAHAAVLAMAGHLASIPLFGEQFSRDFLGGFIMGPATPPRLAMAHVALGFLVLCIALLGFVASRAAPFANPDGIAPLDARDLAPHSAYTGRIFFAVIVFGLIFLAIVTFEPTLGQPIGMLTASPMAMPVDPVPPWYLLGFHGLARAGQSVGGGTILTVVVLLLLGAIPWLDRGMIASGRYRPVYSGFVMILAIDWIVLSIAAAEPAHGIWPAVIDITAIYLFVHFIVITPLVTMLESPLQPPARITRRTV